MPARSSLVIPFALLAGAFSMPALAWDPTLPLYPTTYPLNPGLTEGPVGNFRNLYVDPFTLAGQLKPKRPLARPRLRPQVIFAADRFVISDKIQFETASATVLPESGELLDEIAKALNQHPEVRRIVVEGHTDDVGEDAANLELSQARATAVVEQLVQRGVASERLQAMGKGETEPLVQGQDDEARASNRRVEFVVGERDPAVAVAQAPTAAEVRTSLREARRRQQQQPEKGDLPIRNESSSYVDVTVNGIEIGRLGPLMVGILHDVPSGWYDVGMKRQNGYTTTQEVSTLQVERPPMPGSAELRPQLESGIVWSWHDDPSRGMVGTGQPKAAGGPTGQQK